MTITQRLQVPDPVKVRESLRKIKTLSNSSGNFSQLIWQASKTLGVGYGRFVAMCEVLGYEKGSNSQGPDEWTGGGGGSLRPPGKH